VQFVDTAPPQISQAADQTLFYYRGNYPIAGQVFEAAGINPFESAIILPWVWLAQLSAIELAEARVELAGIQYDILVDEVRRKIGRDPVLKLAEYDGLDIMTAGRRFRDWLKDVRSELPGEGRLVALNAAVALTTEQIERARACDIFHEVTRRGFDRKLRWRGMGATKEVVGACPVCGGTDRFSVHPRKQVFNCRGCKRGGNVIAFVEWYDRVSFREAVLQLVGGERPAPMIRRQPAAVERPAPCENNSRAAGEIWRAAVPIWGTLAERYLRETRGLILPLDIPPGVLRFHPECPFGPDERHPCLIALYQDIRTNKPVAIMRTALRADASKIDRKALGPVGGAAIKLSGAAEVMTGLAIGEGLESTLAGMAFGLRPAWALGSSGAIAKFPLLAGIEVLTILGENDANGANERASRECAGRWSEAGREVFFARPPVGKDLADTLVAVMSGKYVKKTARPWGGLVV
jgi:hypothetical protein